MKYSQVTTSMAKDIAFKLGAVLNDEEATIFADGYNVALLKVNKDMSTALPNDASLSTNSPVIPEEIPKGLAGQIVSLLAHNIGDKFLAKKIWSACRAAMLQAEPVTTANKLGNSQVHSDCCQEQSPIDHGYRPECECSGCKATARICAELIGNSPVIPEGLVKAVHFYEQAKRENPPIETGVWKDAIDWVLKETCLAVSTLESSREHEVISQQEKA